MPVGNTVSPPPRVCHDYNLSGAGTDGFMKDELNWEDIDVKTLAELPLAGS